MGRVVVWAVVKGQGYCASVLAVLDSCAFVGDVADQWPRHIECRLT